jgi:Holliday junction resolvase-like predicted endonuclease
MLNASARDILDALENGFRARADLKGKLAELFAARYLDQLQLRGVIDRYEWQDLDGEPDFIVWLRGGPAITVEAKNIRSGKGAMRAETQKTRASKSDPMSRYYRADQFDVLAVCLYNQTGEWDYIFSRIDGLRRLASDDRYLEVIQVIPQPLAAPWTTDMAELL